MQLTQFIPPNDPPATEALTPLFRISIAFIVVNTLFVLLRFFSVLVLRAKRLALSWDDWLLLPAWMCIVGCCITSLLMVHYETMHSATKHTIFIDPSVTVPSAKIIFADTQLQAAGYALTRLSILALYDRLFAGKKTRLFTYGMIAFVLAQWVAYAVSGVFLCWPVDFAWKRVLVPLGGDEQGYCGDFNLFFRATTPPNIASDVVLIAIPLPTIWRLRTTMTRKIALTVLFFSTIIALVGSCFRQWSFETHDANVLVPAVTNAIVSWIVIEPSLYLLVACLPGMYPLFNQLASRRARQHARATHRASAMPGRPGHARNAAGGSFAALVEPGVAGAFGFEASGARAKEALRESVIRQDTPDELSPVDLRAMTDGVGVLVTTEVTVTQEQRIEDIIGLAI